MLTCESLADKAVAPAKSDEHPRRGGNGEAAWLRWLEIRIESPAARDRDAATNIELARCWGLARRLLQREPAIAAAALHGCSGNGWQILIRVNLSDTAGTAGWVRSFKEGLALRYRANGVAIDISPRTAVEPPPGSLEPGVFDLGRWLAAHGPGPPLAPAQRRELVALAGAVPGGAAEWAGPTGPTRYRPALRVGGVRSQG
jgi:hypothetical protein